MIFPTLATLTGIYAMHHSYRFRIIATLQPKFSVSERILLREQKEEVLFNPQERCNNASDTPQRQKNRGWGSADIGKINMLLQSPGNFSREHRNNQLTASQVKALID